MDFYKDYERATGEYLTIREKQELEYINGKSHQHLYPYKNTFNKGTGEYSSTTDDKIKVLRYMSTHPTLTYQDKLHLQEKLKLLDIYEKKGFQFGILMSTIFFFAPAIRRLPFYKRTPIALLPGYMIYSWYVNFSKDQLMVIGKTMIENWERDLGSRHFQTGH